MPKYMMMGTEEVVEAMQLTHDNVRQVAVWCNGSVREEIDPEDPSKRFAAINLMTSDGVVRASEGAYVLKSGRNFKVMGGLEFERKSVLAAS